MMNVIQNDLWFRYYAYNTPSFCHVRVLQGGEETLVICSEPQNNSGPSVTNTAEVLVPALHRHLIEQGLLEANDRITWLEHYDRDLVYRERNMLRHRFAEILIEDEGRFTWCHVSGELAFLAERYNYPEDCFDIPEESLAMTFESVDPAMGEGGQ